MPEDIQKATLKWVLLVDEIENPASGGPIKLHELVDSQKVAEDYGVPDDDLRTYLRLELEKEESCRSLPFTLLMVISYTAMIVGHDPVVPVNSVESAIIFDVEENANFAFTSPYIGHKGMYDANSHADIWSWMIQGLVPLIFQQSRGWGEGADIPGNPVHHPDILALSKLPDPPRSERGLMLNYNRLIGGLRIRQERGKSQDCETYTKITDWYGRQCSDRFGGSGYELYPELETAKAPYDPQREFWLWAHDDVADSLETLRQKERDNWLDAGTTKVEVMVPIYNGQYGVYSAVLFNFFFSHGGHIWKRSIPFSTYSQWFHGPWNVVPDLLWAFGLVWIFISEGYKVYTTVSSKSVGGLKALRTEYLSAWNIIDWTNVFMGIWVIVGFIMRFDTTSSLNRDLKKLGMLDEVSQREAYRKLVISTVDKLEEEVKSANVFRIMLGVYPLLVVLRVFKAFAHQPRLSIVTRTVYASFVDLLHFLVVFMSVLFSFGVSGIILFGRAMDDFTHPINAANTCFRCMMGDFDWDALIEIGRIEAGCWFFGFMIMVVVLLLNMLLAIVMDAYSEQKAVIGDADTLWYEAYLSMLKWKELRSGRRKSLSDMYRAFRIVKAEEAFWVVTRGMNRDDMKRNKENPTLLSHRHHKKHHKHSQGLGIHFPGVVPNLLKGKNKEAVQESYRLITVENLQLVLPSLNKWQAIEVIEAAILMYHTKHKRTTNAEEMTRVIRDVDDGTKDIRRLLKVEAGKQNAHNKKGQTKSPTKASEKKKEEEQKTKKESGDPNETDSDSDAGKEEEEADLFHHEVDEFEEQFWAMREELKAAELAVGQEYPHEVTEHHPHHAQEKFKDVDLNWEGELIMLPLESLKAAGDASIKCIRQEKDLVLKACRAKDIKKDKDDLRIQSLGKAVRVLEVDARDDTVLCRVPAVGDLWFALECLAHLRPKPSGDMAHHYFGQYAHHMRSLETALVQNDLDDVVVSIQEQYAPGHAEALHKLHDLESELRVGRQTVSEARDAQKELKLQLEAERKHCFKVAQQLESLRKKAAARFREQNHLLETLKHQQEREAMVSKSREDYFDLVFSLFDKKKQLQSKLNPARERDDRKSRDPRDRRDERSRSHGHHNGRSQRRSSRDHDSRRARSHGR